MRNTEIDATSSFVLLERAKAGDATALNALLQRYLPRLRRWASGRLPQSARGALDTEDVIQETLIRALKQFERFDNRGEGALQGYLRQAVLNRLTDLYRSYARQPGRDSLSTGLPADDTSPLEHMLGVDAVQRYEESLQRLRPQEREIIIMRIEMTAEYGEIALAFGLSSAAHARVTLSRALAKLAREMSRD